MFIESFWLRIGLLLAIFSVVAIIDLILNRNESKKWKEYTFVFGMGLLFSVFGIIHHQITVTISPDYYAIGKHLGYDSLRLNASVVGAKSGMYAGVVFGCIFLFLNKIWNIYLLFNWLSFIAKFSFFLVLIGAFIGYIFSFIGVNVIPDNIQNTQYLIVLGWHIGLYSGGVFGLLYKAMKSFL